MGTVDRAVALAIYGSEDQWPTVRMNLLNELRIRRDLYEKILRGCITMPEFEETLEHFDGFAPRDKWFSLPEHGYLVATTYNVFVMAFSEHGGFFCLPAITDEHRGLSIIKLVLGNVHDNSHWILCI
ncbi:hypothetical protein OROHE_002639 [Orobanche hederae]